MNLDQNLDKKDIFSDFTIKMSSAQQTQCLSKISKKFHIRWVHAFINSEKNHLHLPIRYSIASNLFEYFQCNIRTKSSLSNDWNNNLNRNKINNKYGTFFYLVSPSFSQKTFAVDRRVNDATRERPIVDHLRRFSCNFIADGIKLTSVPSTLNRLICLQKTSINFLKLHSTI